MVCSKCSQELKDGAKFCTKCGTKFGIDLTSKNKNLIYLSLILSVVGIVGLIIVTQVWRNSSGGIDWLTIYRIQNIFRLFTFTGILLAILALYKQNCKMAFIAGLIPCGYFILVILCMLLPFLRTLSRFLAY